YATMPLLGRYHQMHFDALRFTGGKREGKPVNTAVTTALVFNPSSANSKNADATPRLLDLATVAMPSPQGRKRSATMAHRVVQASITVSATGEVTALRNADPEWEEHARIALKAWRFAPARRGGNPVAADLEVPLVLTWPREEAGQLTSPRVTTQTPP